jgi:hypothetical protein
VGNELENVLKRERSILKSSPRMWSAVAVVFLALGLLPFFASLIPGHGLIDMSVVGQGFAMAAIACVARQRAILSKLNLEIVKAIKEIESRLGKNT